MESAVQSMFAVSSRWSDFGEETALLRGLTGLSGDSISRSGKRGSVCHVTIEKFLFTEYHEHSLLNFFTFVSLLESAIEAALQLSSETSRQ